MRSAILFVLLVGCSGEQFSATANGAAVADSATDSGTEDGALGAGGAGSGGADSDSGVGSGGAPGNGGLSTGGAAGSGTDGALASTGGLSGSGGFVASGGAPGAGGVIGAGGEPVDACAPVTHDNGLGQTWQDCVPLGTYDLIQAMKACKASEAARCIDAQGCGAGNFVVIGRDSADAIVGAWGYGGFTESFVCAAGACSGCPSGGTTWR